MQVDAELVDKFTYAAGFVPVIKSYISGEVR